MPEESGLTPERAPATLLPMGYGPLPRGLRRRKTKVGETQYGTDIRSQWLPSGSDRRWFPIGTTRTDAEQKTRDVYDLIDRAKRGLPVGKPVAMTTFQKLAEEYLAELKSGGCVEKTIMEARRYIGKALPAFGHLPVVAVSSEEIIALRNAMVRPPQGTGTLRGVTVNNGLLGTLHSVFQYAIKVKRLFIPGGNPVAAVPRCAEGVGEEMPRSEWRLHPRDDRRLLDSLPRKIAAASASSLFVGGPARQNAVACLRVEDIDLIHHRIIFRGRNLKRARRKVRKDTQRPIPKEALHYITEQVKAAQRAGSPWFLPNDDDASKHITPSSLGREFSKHARKAGFKGAYFHGLLHAYTTRMDAAGLADVDGQAKRDAQTARGHDSASATAIYTHRDADSYRPLYDRMSRWLEIQRTVHGPDSPTSPPQSELTDRSEDEKLQ